MKSTRAALRVARSSLDAEKAKASQREQDTFAAQYKLVGVQEALTSVQERLKLVEAERDALKTSLKEEEVARVAAEGRIALPVPKRRRRRARDGDDELEEDEEGILDDDFDFDGSIVSSPTKSPSKHARDAPMIAPGGHGDTDNAGSDKENVQTPVRNKINSKIVQSPHKLLSSQNQQQQQLQQHLEAEVAVERNRREQAEETVEFLKMECQFRCCSCRVAGRREEMYVYDGSMEEGMKTVRKELAEAGVIMDMEVDGQDEDKQLVNNAKHGHKEDTEKHSEGEDENMENEEKTQQALCFSPSSGTFRSASESTPNSDGNSMSAATSITTVAQSEETYRSASSLSSSSSSAASNAATVIERPSATRTLPFKPLLDTIPSYPASPAQDGVWNQRDGEDSMQENNVKNSNISRPQSSLSQHTANVMYDDETDNGTDYADAEEVNMENNTDPNLETPNPRRFMVRTVTTTTQVPLQSTPVAENAKITTPHHHNQARQGHQYPSTVDAYDRRAHQHRHHNLNINTSNNNNHDGDPYHPDNTRPKTPLTAPHISSKVSKEGTFAAYLSQTEEHQQHQRQNDHSHHQRYDGDKHVNQADASLTSTPKHLPIDRAAALAQIQARRGRAQTLAEGQGTPYRGVKTAVDGTGAGGATPGGVGQGRRAVTGGAGPGREGKGGGYTYGSGKRDVSAPAFRGRG